MSTAAVVRARFPRAIAGVNHYAGGTIRGLVMEKDSGLSKAVREMIVVATSAANNWLYCVVAHAAILRVRAKNPRLADQVATNYGKAEITPRQKAMLDFALARCAAYLIKFCRVVSGRP